MNSCISRFVQEDAMTEATEAQESRAQAVTHTATEQASEVGGAVREQAAEVATTARDHAADVMGNAKNEGQQVVERTRQAMEQEARQRTDELARSARRMGDGLVALAEGRPEDAGPVAGYARDAARRVDQFAERLESRGYDGVVADLSSFARRRPGVFLASAGLLGFAVGRVIRSGGASSNGSGGSRPGGAGGMEDATVSMQPAIPRGEPSSMPTMPVGTATGTNLP
jgi:hypothetical protein